MNRTQKLKKQFEMIKAWKHYKYLFWCEIILLILFVSFGSTFAYKSLIAKPETKQETKENNEAISADADATTQEDQTIDSQDNSNQQSPSAQTIKPKEIPKSTNDVQATPEPIAPPEPTQPQREYFDVKYTWRPQIETINVIGQGIITPLGIYFDYYESNKTCKANSLLTYLHSLDLKEGGRVALETDNSYPNKTFAAYNRYIYLEDGTFINRKMVADGYAMVVSNQAFKYKEEFLQLETIAKEKKLGLWDETICQ